MSPNPFSPDHKMCGLPDTAGERCIVVLTCLPMHLSGDKHEENNYDYLWSTEERDQFIGDFCPGVGWLPPGRLQWH